MSIFRHTDDMIQKLREAGLGYSVDEENTTEKFGKRLMYFNKLQIIGLIHLPMKIAYYFEKLC